MDEEKYSTLVSVLKTLTTRSPSAASAGMRASGSVSPVRDNAATHATSALPFQAHFAAESRWDALHTVRGDRPGGGLGDGFLCFRKRGSLPSLTGRDLRQPLTSEICS
ncbi:MAG: hypothetical protein M5U01_28440 [Ardenticatenaceae bacterium]|nr:hypothetical protein [Ardenticatenaceae bacterium]HBY94102.1 hypothetical protein [Chloroflexota bacterium]